MLFYADAGGGTEKKMKKMFGIVSGLLLIAVGVLYILNIFGIVAFEYSLDGWWTLFIILPSLYGLFTSRDKVGNLIGLSIGVYLLLAARDIIEYGIIWKLFIPTVIILLGIKLICKSINGEKKDNNAEYVEVINSSGDYSNKNVKIAKIAAIFGATKCNLTDAKFEEGSSINVFCMFGGAEIIVPENVNIKVNTFSLFGGVSDKRVLKNSDENTVTLLVNGFCMFGGADIK